MPNKIPIFLMLVMALACNGNRDRNAKTTSSNNNVPSIPIIVDTSFLPLDTTDVMIGSYIASLGPDPTSKINSWSIDADALRQYLQDPSIREVNIALSHTMSYINSGHFGIPAGFAPNALTLVIAGRSASGERIPYERNYLLNRAKPCPPICLPPSGTNNKKR